MKFGENLKKLRKSSKLSQEELAEKVNVSRQSVSKWENSESYPEMNNLLELCKIFHCHINDLVNDSIIDIDSLDEETKMSVVKLKKEQQTKMKGLSKAIYIIARIFKIMTIIGAVCIAITMGTIGFLSSQLKVENPGTIKIFGEEITYTRNSNLIEIGYEGNIESFTSYEEVRILNEVLDFIENKSLYVSVGLIESALLVTIFTLILINRTMNHLEKLFVNIYSGDTPFTKENIDHIKHMAMIMIGTIILPNIAGIIAELVIQEDLNIGFELLDVIYILFLLSMAYIFEYGYELQLDSKGKMYGDENE